MITKAAVGILGLLASANALAESWLCISDQSAGVSFKSGSWKAVTFTANDKYILRSVKEGDKNGLAFLVDSSATHLWSDFGNKDSTIPCRAETNQGEKDSGWIRCGLLGVTVTFNKISQRFQHIYSLGFVVPYPNSQEGIKSQQGNTPAITIGTCSQID